MNLIIWIPWAVFWIMALAIISRMFFLADQRDKDNILRRAAAIAIQECDNEKLRKIRAQIRVRKNKGQASSMDLAMEQALELLLEKRRNQHQINY